MPKDTILHMLTTAPNLSPFDVNMAIDAGWQHCIGYTGIGVEDVAALTQDAIFSRGPKGVKRTGLFIGGRDIHQAEAMLAAAKAAMVPPFEVAVFADPSGAFTTAAGMVATAEQALQSAPGTATDAGNGLAGLTALVFGGTGPVGATCAMLAALAGARAVIVSHDGLTRAREAATACQTHHGIAVEAADGSSPERVRELLAQGDVIFAAAKAGVQVLASEDLAAATRARVICDVNAVPPEGVAGVAVTATGEPVAGTPLGAAGFGALSIGNLKYQTQQALLQQMLAAPEPVYLGFRAAFAAARGRR